ncbi:MAG: molybdopterin dinucleotide binding domain-containing protein [Myxococcota bacterium]
MNDHSHDAQPGTLEMPRRSFIGGLGVTATATAISLQGCDAIRKPVEKILPYVSRPEDLIPGNPLYFATSWQHGGAVEGLLVESQEGRPIKIEGNPQHPHSLGCTSGWAQASVHDLYDPDRSKNPRHKGAVVSWDKVESFLAGLSKRLGESKGKGLALLLESAPSPTFQGLLSALRAKYPEAKVYRHDLMGQGNSRAGSALVGAPGLVPVKDLEAADVIVSIDGDPLHSEGETVRIVRQYADGRRVAKPGDTMSRLYAVETCLSVTGSQADHRLRLKGSEIASFVALLASTLKTKGVQIPASVPAPSAPVGGNPQLVTRFVDALAADLAAKKGKSLLMVGEQQPAQVHALATAINVGLGNLGKTLNFYPDVDSPVDGDLATLTDALLAGGVSHLVIAGGNPAYTSPSNLKFGAAIGQATALSLHLSEAYDETSRETTWHLPAAHYLESWGDLVTTDGVASLQQPLIAPLYGTAWTQSELVARLLGQTTSSYELTRAHWQRLANRGTAALQTTLDAASTQRTAAESALADLLAAENATTEEGTAAVEAQRRVVTAARTAHAKAQETLDSAKSSASSRFEKSWRKWLHDGVVESDKGTPTKPSFDWKGLAAAWKPASAVEGYELTFIVDPTIGDGRFANNPWLQEMPDSVTKLTWDNAALMSKATAAKIGVENGDLISIKHEERALSIVALVTMGIADDALVLPMGYGRTHGGRVATGSGFDVNTLRNSTTGHLVTGAAVTPVTTRGPGSTPATYSIALTQTHDSLKPAEGWARRPLARVATAKEWMADPEFVLKSEVMPAEKLKSLFQEPNETTGHQWGMTIDLNTCLGCNACTIACQAENAVPVVGKSEVKNGREMSWVRMDRYYDGTDDDPQAIFQPVACSHCENAPCEQVCPVAATVHSPEGLNDMAYNRCIGTRYCANNCPIKIRRFNFHNYTKRNDEEFGETIHMQRNPDVTVRFRGVMEKCTYCVQRINQARIAAKRDGDGTIAEGAFQPACAQVCPASSITFGNLNDPNSAVSKSKQDSRNYGMLAELNIHSRTTYLAKIRNPNPALAKEGA